MTGEYLQLILKNAMAKADKDGFAVLPEATLLTLYLAHNGVGLTVNRVDGVRTEGNLVHARTNKRETFMIEVGDIFAIALEGGQGNPARRAGFG